MARPFAASRPRDLHDIAVWNHGIVSTADLADLDVPSATVARWRRSDRLVRLAPRAYLVPELLDDRSHLAAVLTSCPTAVASHRAAARLWALDGVEEDLVETTVPEGRQPAALGVHHRSTDLERFEVRVVDGLRCTDPTRTLCDLGAVVDEPVVEEALEAALRARLTSMPRLRWRAGQLSRRGRRGPCVLRRLLDARPDAAPPTDSDLETRFVQCLRAARLPLPMRQHPVRLPAGRTARLDFAWPERRLFVEVDGARFHGEQRRRDDLRRQTDLVLLGWTPLRFTWSDVVGDPVGTAARVATALHDRSP